MAKEFDYNWKADTFDTSTNEHNVPLRWICKGLSHDGFSFAESIYINKVFVQKKDGTPVELVATDFKVFKMDEVLEGESRIKQEYQSLFEYGTNRNSSKFNFSKGESANNYYFNRHNFNTYAVNGPVVAFKSTTIDADNPLYVFSAFSVGNYGTEPPHEFSGRLPAARLQPTVWFGTKSADIVAVRVDFRFHLRTDDNAPVPSPMGLSRTIAPVPTSNNFASIIRDSDRLPILSCFNKLSMQFEHLLGYFDVFATQRAKVAQEFDEVFSKGNFDHIDDLIEAVEALRATISQILTLIGEMLEEVKVAVSCALQDARNLANLGLEVLKTQIDKLLDQLKLLLVEALEILGVQLAILFVLAERKSVRTMRRFWEMVPGDIFGIESTLSQREMELSRQLKSLREADAKLKKLFGLTLDNLWKGLVYVFAKTFNLINFESAEKPVQNEIVGNYVLNGQVEDTWDNLHWWGTNFLPSAPGAFHCIHQHFRWSRFLGAATDLESFGIGELFKYLGGGGKPDDSEKATAPFRSLVQGFRGQGSIGGPLIDPGLADQTIRFAIARLDSELDKALAATVVKDNKLPTFVDIASSVEPQQIAKSADKVDFEDNFEGDDIVYWLSIEAKRGSKDVETYKGTLFINGFYFAHDEEPPASFKGSDPTNFAAVTKGTSTYTRDYSKPVKVFREPH